MVAMKNPDPELPLPDDGWWASVLADDENLPPGTQKNILEELPEPNPKLDWAYAEKIFHEDAIIFLIVMGYNKGGLLVRGNDLEGFVPCSHLVNLPALADDDLREAYFSEYMGHKLGLKIIECVPEENRLVLSERAAKAAAGKRKEIFTSLRPGIHVKGDVTNVTDFGAFVDLGGVEGLIHISELSWGRVIHPAQIVQVGQRVEVVVLDLAPERCRIALSLKRTMNNPWQNAEENYPIDSIVNAVITTLVHFGAFARLEEGLEGLIHVSEIPLPSKLITHQDVLKPGQMVKVRVLQVDASRQRLGLSMNL